MKKHCNNVSVILGRLLCIGFTVQIVLGIIWMAMNIDYVQMFGDASYNKTLSELLAGDGDTGILYPAIILVTRAVGEITYIPWYSYLYIVQIILAVVAGYFLMAETEIFGQRKYRNIWGSLVLLTFPSLMQIHMAILVNSLLLSLLVFQIVFLLKAWKCIKCNESRTSDYVYALSGVALFWLLMSLTKYAYFFIGAIPVIAALVGIIIAANRTEKNLNGEKIKVIGKYEARKAVLLSLVTAMVFLGLIIGIDRLTTDTNLSKRDEVNIHRILFERMAWKSRFSREAAWIDEFKAAVDYDVMLGTMLHQDNIKYELEPELEKNVGREEAIKLYVLANKMVWEYSKNEFIHDLLVDAAGYAAPQIMINSLMSKSTYISYTPRNYDSFKRHTPSFSRLYMDYSLLWFELSLAIGAVIVVLRAICGYIKANKRFTGAIVVIAVTCLAIVLRNVMLGNSVYDYKEAGSAMIAWFMVIFVLCGYSIFDEDAG